MEKVVTLKESELRDIIKEEIRKYISEGIDFTKEGEQRVVSVNNNHQNFVDTNDAHDPYLFLDNQRGYRTLSICQRKTTVDKMDSNPLLNALKQRKGWKFKNGKEDLMKLLRNFVASANLLPKYDTIIMTPSNNELNKTVFRYLIRLVPHNSSYENFFEKLEANDVYNYLIDDEYIESNFPQPIKVYNDIDDAFSLMNMYNDGIFSYKYLQKSKYRDFIIQSMKVNMGKNNDLNYADVINGKDVLVFDDTITTGKTISDSGKAINDMFVPKSLTFITLFSALNDENSKQQKIKTV